MHLTIIIRYTFTRDRLFRSLAVWFHLAIVIIIGIFRGNPFGTSEFPQTFFSKYGRGNLRKFFTTAYPTQLSFKTSPDVPRRFLECSSIFTTGVLIA